MDPESKKLLQETFSLAEENNKILHKMRRGQRIASVMQVVYWLIIIGIAVGAFYFLQPYINQIGKFIGGSGFDINQLKNLGNNMPR